MKGCRPLTRTEVKTVLTKVNSLREKALLVVGFATGKTVLKSTHVRSILQQYKEATEPQDEEQQQYKEAVKPQDEEQRKKKQYEEEQIRKCPYCDEEGYMRIADEKDGKTRYSGSIRCPHSEEDIRRKLLELENDHNHLKERPSTARPKKI
jgi:hypothetical protein